MYPGVVGRPTLKMRIANFYLPRVFSAAHEDAEIAQTLLEVLHFLAPPARLFATRTMLHVLRANLPKRGSEPSSALARSAPPNRLIQR